MNPRTRVCTGSDRIDIQWIHQTQDLSSLSCNPASVSRLSNKFARCDMLTLPYVLVLEFSLLSCLHSSVDFLAM